VVVFAFDRPRHGDTPSWFVNGRLVRGPKLR
jgi:hypothetical protein